MEISKKEKAIKQALATLSIDKIYLKNEFINNYRKKNNLCLETTPKLILKRGDNNGNNS